MIRTPHDSLECVRMYQKLLPLLGHCLLNALILEYWVQINPVLLRLDPFFKTWLHLRQKVLPFHNFFFQVGRIRRFLKGL